ncbi:Uncharacterized protein At4g14450, chloroplastic, partial [Linum perenne]
STSSFPAAGQSSRLQRRRPASLQINPTSSSSWNAAIPLLSPLKHLRPQSSGRSSSCRISSEADKPIVFKKWQQPAAPFCYEPEKLKPSFFVLEIGNLKNLDFLDLGSNRIHGSIPEEIAGCRHLTFLDLHSNEKFCTPSSSFAPARLLSG